MNKPVRQLIEGKPALVVIDAHETPSVQLSRLIEAARRHDVPIVFAVNPSAAAATAAPAPGPNEYVIRRRRLSVFFGTELPILLRELGAHTVILAGGETNTAVHYSFLDAHQYDYFCRVAEDCVLGSSPRKHEAALQAMEYMQTGARRRCDEVILALGGVAAVKRTAIP
jgi:nicotinamidase-related amidase